MDDGSDGGMIVVLVIWQVVAAEFSPDGRLLVTGHHTNYVQLYAMPAGKVLERWGGREGGSEYPVRFLSFSPDGKRVAVAFWEGTVAVYPVPQAAALPTGPTG
ncbi:MAG: hypothetical protein M9921_01230 [Fimbriimonadaceae bacterium]|nr:hypothetical protein [Fimbriimonadaceae bacterium]